MASLIRTMRWAAHEKPQIFWSLVVGFAGPLAAVVVPPIRKNYFGYQVREGVPNSYPVPQRARQGIEGYEDP